MIGQHSGLSNTDITQIKRMYACEGRGVSGYLMVQGDEGVNLLQSSSSYNLRMDIIAVDANGGKHTRDSVQLREWIDIGERSWQFIRIKVRDEGTFLSSDITGTQTFPMTAIGYYQDERSCITSDCSRYVRFKYALVAPLRGILRITVHYAKDLPNTNTWTSYTNPYVVIGVMNSSNHITTKNSKVKSNVLDPTWNQELTFGCESWVSFDIQIKSSNTWLLSSSYDSDMSSKERACVLQSNFNINQRHNSFNDGYLIYSFNVLLDINDCSPNPCQNGGTCNDGCRTYSCSCTPRSRGSNCEHLFGDLTFHSLRGVNLPNLDTWWGTSDPYMRIIAYDESDIGLTRETEYRNSLNPNWNDVSFDEKIWKRFTVEVLDYNWWPWSDVTMINRHDFTLSSHVTNKYHKINANNGGYVEFTYSFT